MSQWYGVRTWYTLNHLFKQIARHLDQVLKSKYFLKKSNYHNLLQHQRRTIDFTSRTISNFIEFSHTVLMMSRVRQQGMEIQKDNLKEIRGQNNIIKITVLSVSIPYT